MSLNLDPEDRPIVTKEQVLQVVRDLVEVIETDERDLPLHEYEAIKRDALSRAESLINDLEG